MKLYAIKMPDGTYFAQNKDKYDMEFRFTEDMKKAHGYISIGHLERALSICKNKFKGATIVDLSTGETVKNLFEVKELEVV